VSDFFTLKKKKNKKEKNLEIATSARSYTELDSNRHAATALMRRKQQPYIDDMT